MCKARIETTTLHVVQGPKTERNLQNLAIPESVNKAWKWKFKILQASDFELMEVDYEYAQLIYRGFKAFEYMPLIMTPLAFGF